MNRRPRTRRLRKVGNAIDLDRADRRWSDPVDVAALGWAAHRHLRGLYVLTWLAAFSLTGGS
jgi:hypothetical protein